MWGLPGGGSMQVMVLEALIGSSALERRLETRELKPDDVPHALRDLQAGVVKRSPLAIPIDQPYDLAPLLRYYLGNFAST